MALVSIVVAYFHNRFWWPPDDGAYAYVAERLLAGDVLNIDVRDIHPGYVHFIHVAALNIFGEDLLSLRYPLSILTILQAAIAYQLLRTKGTLAAFSGAVAAGSLSFVQFLNPTANWYALFMAFAVVGCITWLQPKSAIRYVLIGVLLASALLMRQLSGVFLAMGVIVWLLVEQPSERANNAFLGKASLLLIAAGLTGYLISKSSAAAIVMFGIWPLMAVALAWDHLQISNRAVVRMYSLMALGGLIGALPLIFYLIYHDSYSAWFDDVVWAALHLNELSFVSEQSFGRYFMQVIVLAVSKPSFASFLSSAYWMALLALPIATGLLFWRRSRGSYGRRDWRPVSVIALFFAPVSMHYQIPIYLTYTSCLSLVGLLSLARGEREIRIIASLTLGVSAIGIALHAGQPVSRGLGGVIQGKTLPLEATEGIPRASIAMEQREADIYKEIIGEIQRNAAPGERILALPFIPEFYFLSGRPAAVAFLGVPFGIRDEIDLNSQLDQLATDPPKVVINRRMDKYHSSLSKKLIDWVNLRYSLVKTVGDFDVYVAAPLSSEPLSR